MYELADVSYLVNGLESHRFDVSDSYKQLVSVKTQRVKSNLPGTHLVIVHYFGSINAID